eukprot:7914187-Lingulodinium_polyedra.AAC.1
MRGCKRGAARYCYVFLHDAQLAALGAGPLHAARKDASLMNLALQTGHFACLHQAAAVAPGARGLQ